MSNSLVSEARRFRDVVEHYAGDFLAGLAATPERATQAKARIAIAIRTLGESDPKIYRCTPGSVAAAVAASALTGLSPLRSFGHVWIYRRGDALQFEISHRGYAELAARAGYAVASYPIFEGDDFGIESSPDGMVYRYRRDFGAVRTFDRLVGVLVTMRRDDGAGAERWHFLGRDEIVEIRDKSSESYRRTKAGPWSDWPVQMAIKTAIKSAFGRGTFIAPADIGEAIAAERVQYDAPPSTTGVESLKGAPVVESMLLPSGVEEYVDADVDEGDA